MTHSSVRPPLMSAVTEDAPAGTAPKMLVLPNDCEGSVTTRKSCVRQMIYHELVLKSK